MMRSRVLLAFVLVAAAAACNDSPESSSPAGVGPQQTGSDEPDRSVDLRKLLPIGRFAVDVMDFAPSAHMVELSQRFQDAVSQRPQWLLEHAKTYEPGKPLPYDPRFGLTEEEYAEFLALAEDLSLKKKRQATLAVVKKGTDIFVLDGGNSLPELTGIEIDLKNDVVRTPFGTAMEASEVKPSSKQNATGPWRGRTWRLEDGDIDTLTGTVVKFSLGKLERSGRAILYYRVRHREAGQNLQRITGVLHYDLPER